jgi:predicted regulator of Ras-like GTPase activity (Roadblock/LC7/MglB family)
MESLLEELVSGVKGASGAIILETDGEAVQWYAGVDGERLRLRGAYLALELQACRAPDIRGNLGAVSCLVLEYEDATLVAHEIDDDCFVVLELAPSANIGEARFRLKHIAAKLRSEIAP